MTGNGISQQVPSNGNLNHLNLTGEITRYLGSKCRICGCQMLACRNIQYCVCVCVYQSAAYLLHACVGQANTADGFILVSGLPALPGPFLALRTGFLSQCTTTSWRITAKPSNCVMSHTNDWGKTKGKFILKIPLICLQEERHSKANVRAPSLGAIMFQIC